MGERVLMEDFGHLLGTLVGNFETDVCHISGEGCCESVLLVFREPITRGAQEKPDVVEGIPLASTVTGRVLLDATAYLTWSITGECDDVTGAAHAGCILGTGQAMAFLRSLEGIQRRDSHPRTEVISALGPVLVYGSRPSRHPVHSSGPWDDPSRESGPRCR